MSINQVLTEQKSHWNYPKNKHSLTELNQELQRLSLETETSTKNQVKPRLGKPNRKLMLDEPSKTEDN